MSSVSRRFNRIVREVQRIRSIHDTSFNIFFLQKFILLLAVKIIILTTRDN